MNDGKRYSWAAIKAPLTHVTETLDLRDAAPMGARPDAGDHLLHHRKGWVVVWWDSDSKAAKDAPLARLARRGEAIVYASDGRGALGSYAAYWRRGSEVWSIGFDEEMGEFLSSGRLPETIEDYDDEEMDIPRRAATRLLGFDPATPLRPRDVKGVYSFNPAPAQSKRRKAFWLWRLLGLAKG